MNKIKGIKMLAMFCLLFIYGVYNDSTVLLFSLLYPVIFLEDTIQQLKLWSKILDKDSKM